MKKNFLFILVLLSTVSCKKYEQIQFLQFKEAKVHGIKNGNLFISTKAVFNNPNNFRGKLKRVNIYVVYQKDTLAHVTQDKKMSVGSNTNFDVPLSLEVSLSKLQKGLLLNLASLLSKKSVELTFVGDIKVAGFGFTQTIPVNYNQEIKF